MDDTVLREENFDVWYRVDGLEIPDYSLDADRLSEVGSAELHAAIQAGMSITIGGGSGKTSTTSLAFLEPVVPVLRDLRVWTSNRVIDLGVLAGAENLRSLYFIAGPSVEAPDLSQLRHLEIFEGEVTRSIASALRNPNLRFLRVFGSIPKSFARVAGPIEIFDQEGGRSQSVLPAFASPESMRRLTRIGAAQFDLTQLSGMTRLTNLEVSLCKELSGLASLAALPQLQKLTLKGVGARESWDALPAVAGAFMLELTPHPSADTLRAWRAAGWRTPDDPRPIDSEEVRVEEDDEDGEVWGVYMSRFDRLEAAVEALDGSIANGMHGELLILSAVILLREEGAVLKPEPDSESDMTVVYFPTRDQAEQVASLTRKILSSDAETQLHHLRAAASERG